MNAEQWARIAILFQQALEQPAADRRAWLAAHGDEDDVRREVAAMLDAYERDPGFLEQPVDAVASLEAVALDRAIGRRVGPYRIERLLGRGGMGIVYEARRDDESFERRVAIKLLPEWSAGLLTERFASERRMLASLEHHGIARLLDAGSTDGVPYFVMEYVDGSPIDRWCDEHRADLEARIALVERVCEAVAYAHRHLVVHRDLKPANILVGPDGRPTLLDFGIATLIHEDDGASAGLTATAHRTYTPEFASPEQVRGERVTTASDVYALGVVLHLLLTGRHPYELRGRSPIEQMRSICEDEASRPSAVVTPARAAALRGDLDTIVAKALSKVASDRYATVEALAADLRAWRDGRPIAAAPASRLYAFRRFVRRNRMAVAAGAAVLVALVAGGGAAAWQARVARAERDKARNRFAQVRTFSRSLLFDVHRALTNVPGATESRRLLLDRAVEFLDGLAADAGDDNALKLELVEGYRRLAEVQGDPASANVGDTKAALTSLAQASRLAAEAHASEPQSLEAHLAALEVASTMANIETAEGTGAPSVAVHRTLLGALERQHREPRALRALATGYSDAGRFLSTLGDFTAAQTAYETAVARFEALPVTEKQAAVPQHAFALKRLGAVLLRDDRFADAEQRYRAALTMEEAQLATLPPGDTRAYEITFTLSDLALVESRLDRWGDAAAMWQRALDIRKAVSDADPKNVRALAGVATLYGRLSLAARASGDLDTCIARLRDELRIRDRLLTPTGTSPGLRANRAWAALRLAEALTDRADAVAGATPRQALRLEALALVRPLTDEDAATSVPAGSQPEFIDVRKALLARLTGTG